VSGQLGASTVKYHHFRSRSAHLVIGRRRSTEGATLMEDLPFREASEAVWPSGGGPVPRNVRTSSRSAGQLV